MPIIAQKWTSMMNPFNPDSFDRLVKPGPRVPQLVDWLLTQVWTQDRFSRVKPADYLNQGEVLVHHAEEIIATAAWRVYDELAAAAAGAASLMPQAGGTTAFVIFDGLSLRELPVLLRLAAASRLRIVEPPRAAYAALPSDTNSFVEQRLIGKRVPPSQLPQRAELKERAIKAFYLDDAISSQHIDASADEGLLVWSAFPDVTYRDSSARSERHYDTICSLFESAWKNTVMQVPRGRRIVITGDHGYVYFGAGMAATRTSAACDMLEQNRFKLFSKSETVPDPESEKDIQVLPERRLAMLRGRLKNRPQGPSANMSFRHGGLSLMEILVPWLVLEHE